MRWLAIITWTLAALAATFALGIVGAKAGPWPEEAHLLGHLGLCGGMAGAVAAAAPLSPTRRAWAGLAAGMGLGFAIEVVQAGVYPVWQEAAFDLLMDLVGACAGMLAARRDEAAGHVVSAALHPLLVVPAGLLLTVGAPWTAVVLALGAPAVLLWMRGVRAGAFTDADVSERTQRPPLMLPGLLGAMGIAGASLVGPAPVQSLAAVLLVGGVLGAVVTLAGHKASGHVAIPAALGLWSMAIVPRGAEWFLGAALLLTVARWVAGRHRASEVGSGWTVAGVAALAALVV